MKSSIAFLALVAAASLTTSCATADAGRDEPRRVVGTSTDVRVDAQLVARGSQVHIRYQIENRRSRAIAIAEVQPEVSYDGSGVITVRVGSEIPGDSHLPRLVEIKPGERRSFVAGASVGRFTQPRSSAREMRLKVVFLNAVDPFSELVGIAGRTVDDPQLAAQLFDPWLEHHDVVTTNSVPLRSALFLPIPEQGGWNGTDHP